MIPGKPSGNDLVVAKGHQGPGRRPTPESSCPSYLSSLKRALPDSVLTPFLITNDFHTSFALAEFLGLLLCQDKPFSQDKPIMVYIFRELGECLGRNQVFLKIWLLESPSLETYLGKEAFWPSKALVPNSASVSTRVPQPPTPCHPT